MDETKLSRQQKDILLWLGKQQVRQEWWGVEWWKRYSKSQAGRNGTTASQRASISRSLRRLEERGLIERKNNIREDSKVTTHVKLTDKGKETVNALLGA